MSKRDKRAKSTENVLSSAQQTVQPEKPGEKPMSKASIRLWPNMTDRTYEDEGDIFAIIGGVASVQSRPRKK